MPPSDKPQPRKSTTEKPSANASRLVVKSSPGLADWLAEQGIALAITTYQAGRLVLVGSDGAGKLIIHQRKFPRAMGAWSNGDDLWLATRHQLWQLVDTSRAEGNDSGPRERRYLPKVAHSIGRVDIHDVAVDDIGDVLFIATRMNCLARLDPRANFAEVWRPTWVTELVTQDRAHVNGFAMVDGQAKYATVCGETNTPKGWKENRETGGVVVDITTDEIVASGLSMPHSPRWYNDQLWVLNSGEGQLGTISADGKFESLAFLPGYLRGLAFHETWALVGLSRPRHQTFAGLGLDARLAAKEQSPQTGVMVVDADSGEVAHWLCFEGSIVELYDVVVLPKTTRARSLSLENDDLQRYLWVDTSSGQTEPFVLPRRKKTS